MGCFCKRQDLTFIINCSVAVGRSYSLGGIYTRIESQTGPRIPNRFLEREREREREREGGYICWVWCNHFMELERWLITWHQATQIFHVTLLCSLVSCVRMDKLALYFNCFSFFFFLFFVFVFFFPSQVSSTLPWSCKFKIII